MDAFLELAAEQDTSSIDVQMVMEAASLNRSTFYLHFPSRDALREAVFAELVLEVTAGGDSLLGSDHPDLDRTRTDWHETFITTIAQRPRLFARLLAQSGAGSFPDHLSAHHAEGLLTLWSRLGYDRSPSGTPLTLWARYTADGLNGMVRLWLDDGMKDDPEALSIWIWNLCFPLHVLPLASPANDTRTA